LALSLSLAVCGSACGADMDDAGSATADDEPVAASVDPATPTPAIKTVFLIVFENKNWWQVKGSWSAPYINNVVLPQASYAEGYMNPAGLHPSEGNYIWMEAGDNLGVTNDLPPAVNHQSTTLHLSSLLDAKGVSWRSYQEDIPGTECPLVDVNKYAPKHNPFVYFDDVNGGLDAHNAYCIAHVRPYSELERDLAANTVARYNFITPNLCHDMHDFCSWDPVRQGDDWLKAELPKILASRAYQDGGAVIITFDEAWLFDGPIPFIVLSPLAKGGGYHNNIRYDHSSLVRSLEDIFGVQPYLRAAANATDLRDLFRVYP
jgi:phospholipase C